jgi:cytidylate kinase
MDEIGPLPLHRVVTIDGPSGAGKSTLARRLAELLGWRLLDTGAMYRAAALAALRRGVKLDDDRALGELAGRLEIELPPGRVVLDGEDVTAEIRQPEVSAAASRVAAWPSVRACLVRCQRAFAERYDTVAEGRDQGTVVFPDAFRKVYLVASAETRAERRHAELEARGQSVALASVLSEQDERDARDAGREASPMRPAEDALVIDSTGVPIERVVEIVLEAIRNGEPAADRDEGEAP